MHSRAECYRRRGLVAKQRAAQTTDLSLKEAFKDVARHWLMVAERLDWLDRQHNGPVKLMTRTGDLDDIQKKEPARLLMARSEVPRNRGHGFNRTRAVQPAGHGENLGLPGRPS
jgi:hypothetical protein